VFDQAAKTYDNDFTHSNIGRVLRNTVWAYLNTILPTDHSLNILELNCGTGEDAIRFAKRGHYVVATDIAEEMVSITKQKVKDYKLAEFIKPQVCDVKNIMNCKLPTDFDLIFSNFGGLNCLDHFELQKLSDSLFKLLKPNGRFVAVVMPKFSLWESVYYTSKFRTEKIFQRNTNDYLEVSVGDSIVKTWYYSPGQFAEIFQSHFQKLVSKPIGFAIPPSYMEAKVGRKKPLMHVLSQLEYVTSQISFLSGISDHFIMDLQKRNMR
jgi:SAM-dependent methyltransferase